MIVKLVKCWPWILPGTLVHYIVKLIFLINGWADSCYRELPLPFILVAIVDVLVIIAMDNE